MNKNLYRIVFNKARGMLMVVADIASSGRSAASPSSGQGSTLQRRVRALSPIQFALLMSLGCVSLNAQANIVADGQAPANQQPTVLNSANGTPQINIQTPSAAGVSRNSYSQFDVDQKGAILNNSHNNVATQQGGMVQGNPWLARGEAKIILNEVNSRDPSLLNGYVEVAGRQAQVIIANPSGISCNGCGFINANRATMTTGQAQLNNGQLTGFDVERGEIVVQGAGLDSSRQDHTDLIARTVKVNAGIWAKELNVTAGQNVVNPDNTAVSAKSTDDTPHPQLALDVSQLGGMYAGKIRFIGTETGVGVHNAGVVGASAGDVVVNADGSITNSGAINSTQDIQLNAKNGVDNQGKVYAAGNVQVNANGQVSNSGIIAARQTTTVNAAGINSTHQGVLAAGMESNGTLGSAGDLVLNSQGKLHANGQNSSAGRLTAQGSDVDLSGSQTYGNNIGLQASSGDVSTAGANLAATHNVQIHTGGMLNNNAGKIAADKLDLSANTLSNQQGTLQQLGQQDLTLSHAQGINNAGGTIATNSQNVTLTSNKLNNQQGNILHAGEGKLAIEAQEINGNQGKLITNGNLSLNANNLQLNNANTQAKGIALTANTLSHRDGQMLQTGEGPLSLNVGQAIDNQRGSIAAHGDVTIEADTFNNQQGTLIAADNNALSLRLGSTLDNRAGTIAAGGSVNALTGKVDNSAGLIQAGDALSLNTQGADLLNANSGEHGGLISSGTMSLKTADLDNHSGQIAAQTINASVAELNNQSGKLMAQQALSLTSGNVDNQSGQLSSQGSLIFNGGSLDNRQGQTYSKGDLFLDAEDMDNRGGQIASQGNLTLTGGELDNRKGQIASQGNQSLISQNLDNRGGQITSLDELRLFNTGVQNDDAGVIQSAGNLDINTQGNLLSNSNTLDKGGITSQGGLSIHSAAMNNQQGTLIANQQMTLNTADLNNQQGTIAALGDLAATTGAVNNVSGTLQSGKTLTLATQGKGLNNQQGRLSAAQALTLTSGDINNQQGLLASGEDMSLSGLSLDNSQAGQVVSKQSIKLSSGDLNNQQGQIQALGNILLNAAQSVINNTAGLINAAQDVTLNTAQLVNQNTRATNAGIQAENLHINATGLDNRHGALLANNDLTLSLDDSMDNSSGLVSAKNSVDIQTGDAINTGGDVEAGKALNLRSDSLSGEGKLLSLGDMTLRLKQDFLNTGTVQAQHDLSFTTQGNINNTSLIQAGNTLDLSANSIVNGPQAEISANTTQLRAAQTLTNYGLIDGFTTRISGQEVNNIGTGRIYGDALALQAGTLNNLALEGKAATIAARQRLDIGVGTLNNLDHGLIYSDGAMAIGAALNADYLATGQANTLNNHSSTIESAGDMALNVAYINNINDHFSLENVLVSKEDISEYEVARLNNGIRYNDKDYTIYIYQDEVNILCIEGVICHTTDGDRFTHYAYTRTTTEDRVKESDPAKIIAGGNININTIQGLNDKSQIITGGTVNLQGGTIDNTAAPANRQTTDKGTATFYSRHQEKHSDSSNVDTTDYVPPTEIQQIDLKVSSVQEHTLGQGSGLQLADQQKAEINGNVIGANNVNIGQINGPAAADFTFNFTPENSVLPKGKTFEVKGPNGDEVVRIIGPNTRLPDNSLFQLRPDVSSAYLVETDPRFTDQNKWLGSDYMQNAFGQNSDNLLKRLGDGYYEQKLIREQVIALTGQRFLNGFASDEDQFKNLMNNGIDFGKQFNLTLGVALTAEQMSQLTKDMVWLVAQNVTMPDGSAQQVLVPQVYTTVRPGDIDGSGALLAGKNINLNLTGDLTNSGHLFGKENAQLIANNINNVGGLIQANDVTLKARTDINNLGGVISGANSLLAGAGRDINVTTATRSAESAGGDFARTTLDRVAGLYVQQPDGSLILQAGRDVNLNAAQVINSGEGGLTAIAAGRDVNLTSTTTASRDNLNWGDNWLHQSQTKQVGSDVIGKGNVQLAAGNNVNVTAGNVSASQRLDVAAGNDINITHATDTETFDQHYKATGSSSFGSKTTTESRDTFNTKTVQGSQLNGDTLNLSAGHDLNLEGSSAVGTSDVNLRAGNDLNILAATGQRDETHFLEEKKSGISGTGGVGVTFGTNSVKTTDDGQSLTSAGSTVGSTQGNVNLMAGNGLTVKGSDVLGGKDLNLTGKEVNILAADNQSVQTHTVEQKQSGLTLALSGAVGSAINSAVSSANDASTASSGRLAALDGIKSALGGVQAYQASQLGEAQGQDQQSLFGVNLSYGSQSSKSEQTQTNSQSQGSTLTAGNNLNIRATDTDINVQGGQLQAGKDIGLMANRDVNLISATNTSVLDGKNESHGGSVGVGINFGKDTGFTVSASANKGKGSESGNGVTHTETTLNAGHSLNIVSGRDTTLTGAQLTGDKVTMDVGRNLTLTSEQDSDNYDSKQQNASAGGSFTFGSMSGSAGVNLSKDKMHSTYDSVKEQTGIFAGKGGFDLTVGEHTQLNGAVIGSTADASKNRLDTGTLGFGDIQNRAEYEVEHQSVGISTGGNIGSQFVGNMASSLLVGVNGKGSDGSTTKSAVSDGNIIIRDGDQQTQNVADLSRDVEHANQTLSPIFDKEKEQRRLQEAQKIGEIGSQVMDIARTQGKIAEANALKDPNAIQAAKEALAAKGNLTPTDKQVTDQVRNTASANYGTGSALQQGIQAATAAIQGLAGGDLKAALAGGTAPYLAEVVKNMTTNADGSVNVAANAMAHAVVGAVVAQLQGNSAAAGAAGAASGELAARLISQEMYPGVRPEDLTEEQKQTLSALGTLAAGLAGGLSGDSSADAVTGGQAGKTAVDNNLIGGTEWGQSEFVQQQGKDILSCADNPGSESCQRGKAVQNAVGLALGAGAVGGAVIAITPEIIAAAQAGASACAASPVLCANEVSLWAAEMAAGDALPAGLTVGAVGKMSVSELSELKALIAVEKQTGKKVSAETVEQLVKPVGSSGPELKVIELNSGNKGNWSKDLNKPEPNTLYKVDGNKTYQTDDLGRVNAVEADLLSSVKDRNTYQQCKTGKCGLDGDEGGHLIASIFDGPGEKLNLVPMDGNLNKGAWKQMENTWANALKDGKPVNVKIEPVYSGDSVRPESFNVIYTINGGRPKEQAFINAPGGK